MFEALLKGLAARGHQVYVVGHWPQKKPISNYTDISVEGSWPGSVNNFTMDVALELSHDTNLFYYMWNTHLEICRTVLEQPKVRLINGDDKFDLIIIQIFWSRLFSGSITSFQRSDHKHDLQGHFSVGK
jgi:glucuronosyltransferase